MVRLFSFNVYESHFVMEVMTETKQFLYQEVLVIYIWFKTGLRY